MKTFIPVAHSALCHIQHTHTWSRSTYLSPVLPSLLFTIHWNNLCSVNMASITARGDLFVQRAKGCSTARPRALIFLTPLWSVKTHTWLPVPPHLRHRTIPYWLCNVSSEVLSFYSHRQYLPNPCLQAGVALKRLESAKCRIKASRPFFFFFPTMPALKSQSHLWCQYQVDAINYAIHRKGKENTWECLSLYLCPIFIKL